MNQTRYVYEGGDGSDSLLSGQMDENLPVDYISVEWLPLYIRNRTTWILQGLSSIPLRLIHNLPPKVERKEREVQSK